jgi:electron transfer flavoprotein beta subunit
VKIVVCAKYVPTPEASLKLIKGGENFEGEPMMMNETDEHALEEALDIKRKVGGEVVVVTAGGIRASEVLYYGLAKGADKAVRIDFGINDSEVYAQVIAEAVKRLGYDLVLTGIESGDNLSAQVGMRIAEILGIPGLLGVVKVEVLGDSRRLRVIKEVGGGVKEVLETPLPAVLGIHTGTRSLSYVTLRKRMEARSKGIILFTTKDLGINEKALSRSVKDVKFSFPAGKKAKIIKGEPREIVRVLLEDIKGVLASG